MVYANYDRNKKNEFSSSSVVVVFFLFPLCHKWFMHVEYIRIKTENEMERKNRKIDTQKPLCVIFGPKVKTWKIDNIKTNIKQLLFDTKYK